MIPWKLNRKVDRRKDTLEFSRADFPTLQTKSIDGQKRPWDGNPIIGASSDSWNVRIRLVSSCPNWPSPSRCIFCWMESKAIDPNSVVPVAQEAARIPGVVSAKGRGGADDALLRHCWSRAWSRAFSGHWGTRTKNCHLWGKRQLICHTYFFDYMINLRFIGNNTRGWYSGSETARNGS